MGLPPPEVEGHNVRNTAKSWAGMVGVSSKDICNAATWSSTCTFALHYKLDLHERGLSQREVLHYSASSTAEKTLRRHLGRRSTVPSSTVSAPDYRIPKLLKTTTKTASAKAKSRKS